MPIMQGRRGRSRFPLICRQRAAPAVPPCDVGEEHELQGGG